MDSISEIWAKSKGTFGSKSISQILSFAGDGKLKDNNETSKEFRELLDKVESKLLKQFAENCLSEKFDDGGFALQDVINQIGTRLGFSVTNGLYRGKQNDIGYDGIWHSLNGHNIVVEVKTTDAYRINLDTIAAYRNKLIEQDRISKIDSSILIVVGRQDTGDLEAQIRGSQHAWDIRLISTDSLLKLLSLKENLDDSKTIQQINGLLKPKEYTRIDKLIELIFLTSEDILLANSANNENEEIEEIEGKIIEKKTHKSLNEKAAPVNFHDKCIEKIESKLNLDFIKRTRSSYSDNTNSIGLTCAVSKQYKQGKFWFGFLPHQQEFLQIFENSYIAFGCGSPDEIILIPYKEFEPFVENFSITVKEDRMYWHVTIYHQDNKYYLTQPKAEGQAMVDISKYRI